MEKSKKLPGLVPKKEFDALLHKMMQSQPEPAKTIKPEGKAGKIIPAPTPASDPNKA